MFDSTEYKTKMQAVLDRFKDELKKVRTGRAHPDMLMGVKVEAYGQWMPLNQVANVVAQGATRAETDAIVSLLTITPFDPANISAISAAIRNDQSLGLNPSDDGRLVRVPIPPLTEERRREIVKTTSAKVEEAKVSLRNIREDARKELKSAEFSEDVRKRGEKEIDDLTKSFSAQIDSAFSDKEAEIMKI